RSSTIAWTNGSSCPASSFWHSLSGLILVDRVQLRVGQDLDRAVEAQGLVRPDVVEHAALVLGLAVQVLDRGYLLVDSVEVLVLQRSEAALAHPVLPW